ncbi:hypothetical protein EDB86DRAFT_2882449 [Lactarius hatsudake]|nr:hypothetical protein EDB86DRAFT_2882449 [Lactarius hatsudake]
MPPKRGFLTYTSLPCSQMNDYRRLIIQVAVGAIVGIVLTPVVVPPILYALGFSATGPVDGTATATMQAGIGYVAAGSFFAMAQSVATGGVIPAVIRAGLGGLFGAFFSTRLASEIMRQVRRVASAVVAGIHAAAAKVAGAWRRPIERSQLETGVKNSWSIGGLCVNVAQRYPLTVILVLYPFPRCVLLLYPHCVVV